VDARHQKAEAIVAGGKITRGNGYFLVPSATSAARHKVVLDALFPSCTCADFELTERACKHMLAVKLWLEQEQAGATQPAPKAGPAPRIPRKTYRQDWPNYNLAQNREKDHVQELLADLCRGRPGPVSQKRTKGGRKPVAVRDAVFTAVFKVYTGFSARRCMSDLRAAHKGKHIGQVLCHNSVLKALENPALTPILKELVGQSALPLRAVETKFAVDSSGFCTSRFTRFFDVKYGVTVNEVSADKAYTCTENLQTVAQLGGTLYSPFRKNTTGGIGGIFERAFHDFCLNRDEFLARYHLRSNVESTFSGVKRLTGDAIRSKTDTAMANEVYCTLIAWNLTCLVHAIYELGITPVFWEDPAEEPNAPANILKFPRVG
jgi:hypothetical protein